MSLQAPSPVKRVHLTLKLLAKGSYTWEVSVHDDVLTAAERDLQAADQWLNATYGQKEGGK